MLDLIYLYQVSIFKELYQNVYLDAILVKFEYESDDIQVVWVMLGQKLGH